MTTTTKSGRDAYQEITDRLIELMQDGTNPWASPYTTSGLPLSMSTGKPYRGINILLLGFSPYTSPYWGTYKKITELGGQVRKGEKGTMVVFWKRFAREAKDETGRTVRDDTGRPVLKNSFVLRYYTVFNAEQADNLPAKYHPTDDRPIEKRLEQAETIITGYDNGPRLVSEDQTCGWYLPISDTVNVPKPENMKTLEEWYSCTFHELTHSTGHKSRLNREGVQLGAHKRGSVYAFEELVAEMGAAILCSVAGIDGTFENSAAYLRGWIQYLTDDPQAAVRAAGKAQRAVDRILGVTWEDAES